jgi:hypothetical protein
MSFMAGLVLEYEAVQPVREGREVNLPDDDGGVAKRDQQPSFCQRLSGLS